MIANPENLKIGQKGVILVSVPMLIGTLFLLTLSYMLYQSESETQSDLRAKNILLTVDRISALETTAQIAAVKLATNYDRKLLDDYKEMVRQRRAEFQTIEEQLASAPQWKERENSWRIAVEREFNLVDSISDNSDYGGESIFHIHGFRRQLAALVQHESVRRREFMHQLDLAQEKSRSDTGQWQSRITILLAIGIAANVLLSLLLSTFYSRGIIRRLGILVDNSLRLSSGRPLNPRISGSDEIAQLDQAFHAMVLHLAEAARKEKAIVDDAADVICSLDPHGLLTTVNAASSKLWGYSAAELIGRPIFKILATEDQLTTRNALHALSTGNPQVSLENRVWCQDRSFVHMLWSIRWSEQRQAYFCVAHDITQRKLAEALIKESEARVRLILGGMPVGLLITDEDSCIEMTNNKAEQMFALKAPDMAGKPLHALFSSERGTSLTIDEVTKRLSQPTAGPYVELEARKSTGELFPAELTPRQFMLNSHRKMLIVVTDISPRREVERLKQDFFSMVSHDLRSPLTSIVGTVKLLQVGLFGALNEVGVERVDVTVKEVDRLIGLVNSLLDIEKLEAGRMDLQMEDVVLESIVSTSVQSLAYLANQKGLTIVTDVPSCKVRADSSSLVQVLVNLLDNAIKFSPEGSTITVSAQVGYHASGSEKLDPDMVQIRVKDRGRGIPESHKQDVFDRFKQVELADRVQKKGSGLGLAICKSIVAAHHGEIGVESEVGDGSTFWFTIPSA